MGMRSQNQMRMSRLAGIGFGVTRHDVLDEQATAHRDQQVAVCAVNAVGVAYSV